MVHQMVGTLIKRGAVIHDTFRKSGGPQHGEQPKTPEQVAEKLPAGLMVMLVVTFFALVVVVTLVRISASLQAGMGKY